MHVETVDVNIKKQLNNKNIQCVVKEDNPPNPVAEYFFKIGKRCYKSFHQYDPKNPKKLDKEEFVNHVKKFKECQEKINKEIQKKSRMIPNKILLRGFWVSETVK